MAGVGAPWAAMGSLQERGGEGEGEGAGGAPGGGGTVGGAMGGTPGGRLGLLLFSWVLLLLFWC
jgi:hypothetical protein